MLKRTSLVAGLALTLAVSPASAQTSAQLVNTGLSEAAMFNAPVVPATVRAELLATLDRQATALARGVLPVRFSDPAPIDTRLALRPAGGGGGSVFGALLGSLGPLSNSFSSLTRSDDPMASNGTSDALAGIGAGLAVIGGITNIAAASGGGDELASARRLDDPLASVSERIEKFREQQVLAAELLDEIEEVSDRLEAGHDDERALARMERTLARYDFITTNAARLLSDIRWVADPTGHASDVAFDNVYREAGAAEALFFSALEAADRDQFASALTTVRTLRDSISQ